MSQFAFTNNASTTLAANISSTATSLQVASGTGGRFPVTSSSQWFPVTLVSSTNTAQTEVCYCTGRNGDTLTVTRGAEGTTASSFSAGDTVALFPTAGVFGLMPQAGSVAPFSTATATAIGGYTLNAIVADTTVNGLFWVSTVANNTTTPGASGASWRAMFAGAPPASKGGTVTAWERFTANGTFTIPNWARTLETICVGGGAGGSNCVTPNGGQSGLASYQFGSGGGAGGYAHGEYPVSLTDSLSATVGAGGAAQANGGSTYVTQNGNTILTANGGGNGTFTAAYVSPGGPGGSATGGNIVNAQGNYGTDGQSQQVGSPCGSGGAGPWGGAGRAGAQGGKNGSAPGAGGGGAYSPNWDGNTYYGGSGSPGIILYRFRP